MKRETVFVSWKMREMENFTKIGRRARTCASKKLENSKTKRWSRRRQRRLTSRFGRFTHIQALSDSWCDIRAHEVNIKWCILIVHKVSFVMVNSAFSEMNLWDNWVNFQPSFICRLLLINSLASWHCLERKAAFWATCKFHAQNDKLRQAHETFLICMYGIISTTGRFSPTVHLVSWS